ncbi:MAG: allantoate amidohydrolase [Mycobacteriales bacterium]
MTLEESFLRLWHELEPLGRNCVTGGYNRFAWTAEDDQLRTWFRTQAARRDMTVVDDRNGNQWAWWGEPGSGAVVTGSHLDSVPEGGAYDGPLGVVSGFLAVDELRADMDAGAPPPANPVAVVRFADEEGARFGVACVGSRLLTGVLDPQRARELRDADGVTLADAMRAAGADPDRLGRDDEALSRIGAFVELHVEQGRGLVDAPAPIGTATVVRPHGRWRMSFTGRADHAGTTRLADRADPTLPFAVTVQAAREAAEHAGGLATISKARIEPGGTNGIAARVHAWLDARGPDDVAVHAIVEQILGAAQAAAAAHGVSVEFAEESFTPIVEFDPALGTRLRDVLGAAYDGLPALPSGAGHDAGILAAVVPSAMLFVRNPTGVSHSPAESADLADCIDGVRALQAVLKDLAC